MTTGDDRRVCQFEDEIPKHVMYFNAQHTLPGLVKLMEAINSSSILTMTDSKGAIVMANENFQRISGYSLEELLGRQHSIVNSGFHPRSFWIDMWRMIVAGEVWRGEVCNRAKDGSIYWVDTFIYPIEDDAGNISNFFSVRNDITEKKTLTNHLSSSERKLKAIFDGTSDIFFLLDPAGGIVEHNAAADQLLRAYAGRDFNHGRNIMNYLGKEEHRPFLAKFHAAVNGAVVEEDQVFELPDGSLHWYQVRMKSIRSPEDGVVGITLHMVDIHRRKMHELVIEEKNKRLSEISRIYSHELRGPVATIMGLVNLLEGDPHMECKVVMPHMKNALDNLDSKIRSIVYLTY